MSGNPPTSLFDQLLGRSTPRRSVFISYHHELDHHYYEEFTRIFSDLYQVVRDASIERDGIDSTNTEYVIRRIREDYITGTSCTIILCGEKTPGRKYVDWEMKASLDKEHGLIGVYLPTCQLNDSKYLVPGRLHDNIESGYASFLSWASLTPAVLPTFLERAANQPAAWIKNSRPLMVRNG